MIIDMRLSSSGQKITLANFAGTNNQPDGMYLTLDQAAFSERIAQSGLFAIDPDGRLRR